MNKIRLFFEKSGNMRFVGHLDLLKAIQRGIIRAGLPIAYSKGFNPHQLTSFALPLPLGFTGLREILELDLETFMSADDCAFKLNNAMPEGINVYEGVNVPDNKTAASLVYGTCYRVEMPFLEAGLLSNAVQELCKATDLIVEKEVNHKLNYVNIRDGIYDVSAVSNSELQLSIAAGSIKSIRLDDVLTALCNFIGITYTDHKPNTKYTRICMLLTDPKAGERF